MNYMKTMLATCSTVLRGVYKYHNTILSPRAIGGIASRSACTGGLDSFEHILTETTGKKNNIAIITLNSPKTLNSLCDKLMFELGEAVKYFDADPSIACLIVTGKGKAFAAGADIMEMLPLTMKQTFGGNFLSHWDLIAACRKPVIAAVNGYALGGGCEIAMMCDIIYAGEKAKFGQPEIKLGTIPGAGGTQRMTKAIGKSRAMEMILTGDMMDAAEAARIGLASKVVPDNDLMPLCIELAEKISKHSKFTCAMAKEAVNKSYELSLKEGLHFEKRLFHLSFATNDRKEGMSAFSEKREANFTDS